MTTGITLKFTIDSANVVTLRRVPVLKTWSAARPVSQKLVNTDIEGRKLDQIIQVGYKVARMQFSILSEDFPAHVSMQGMSGSAIP